MVITFFHTEPAGYDLQDMTFNLDGTMNTHQHVFIQWEETRERRGNQCEKEENM